MVRAGRRAGLGLPGALHLALWARFRGGACSTTGRLQGRRALAALLQMRSTRNFFIDLILICILLAIGLYIYNILK